MSHKSEDYKISAVNYYNKNDVSMDDVCNIFNCSKTLLKRWIDRYSENNSLVRDCNGATNIYKIAKNAINKKLRPSYLTRGNTSGVLDDTVKT